MSDTNDSDREHWHCPACDAVMYPQGAAPGVYWCEECQREYWREGEQWWRCDESGDPERVSVVTDGGRPRPPDRDWLVTCPCGAEYTPKGRHEPDTCYACGLEDIDARPLHTDE